MVPDPELIVCGQIVRTGTGSTTCTRVVGHQGPCDGLHSTTRQRNGRDPILHHRYRIRTRETILVEYELVAETAEDARAWMTTKILPNGTRGLIANSLYRALSRVVLKPPAYAIESIERIG